MTPSEYLRLVFFAALWSGSAAAWTWIAVRWWQGRPPLDFRPREPVRWSLLPILLFVAWIATTRSTAPAELQLEQVQRGCLISAVLVAVYLVVLGEFGRRRLSEFGIELTDWRRRVFEGALGFFASVPPVFAVQYTLLLTKIRGQEQLHPLLKLLQTAPAAEAVPWIGLAAIVLAPLFEELLYRVVLQGWLESVIPAGAAIAASSVLFAAVHGWPDALPLLPLAAILGYVYHRTHSYLAVVVLHALFNGTNVALGMLSAR